MRLKWIKLPCDIYFSPKFRLLSDCECGSIYQLIYIYMLCLAGKSGEGGVLRLSSGKPYDGAMLARIFDIDKATVERALRKMRELDLISQSKNALIITDWSDLQFLDEMPIEEAEEEADKSMERNLTSTHRVRRYREKIRLKRLSETNETLSETQNETNETLSNVSFPIYISLDKNKNRVDDTIQEKEKEEKEFDFYFFNEDENSFSSDIDRSRTAVDIKECYGELRNVYLTKSEYDGFKAEFPLDYSERIDELSLYMASSGKEYCDHYATLKSFSKRRIPPNPQGSGGENMPLFSTAKHSAGQSKPRYGDFDPEQAMRDAIARSESEFE